MSGGLVPSKSTVYVSNLPFSLTNNDLHKIFEFYGKVVKVTIVKDRKTRQSKGIAFVLFLTRESAHVAVRAVNNRQMFGRTLKCSIAVDNGRASEFIRRVYYADKRRCYECGDSGHLSYQCPKNILGDREPPKKKRKRKRKLESQNDEEADEDDEEDEDEQEGEDPALESLSAAIQFQQQKIEEEEYRQKVASGSYQEDVAGTHNSQLIKKRIRQDQYFSDEEVEDDPNE